MTPQALLAEAILSLEPALTRSEALRIAARYLATKGAN